MKPIYSKLLTENKTHILENVKQAKEYVKSGKLSEEDLKTLIEIDPTPTRKFVGWMAKQWINKTVTDIDDLRNTVEEYNTFLKGVLPNDKIDGYDGLDKQIKTKDIKTYTDIIGIS
jgi:hypothetical protein